MKKKKRKKYKKIKKHQDEYRALVAIKTIMDDCPEVVPLLVDYLRRRGGLPSPKRRADAHHKKDTGKVRRS